MTATAGSGAGAGMALRRRLPASQLSSVVVALSAAVLVEWMAGTSILPLLPLFVHRSGGSLRLVGLVLAAFFAASFLTQYPLGRLSDRIGRRSLLLGSLLLEAGATAALALPVPVASYVGLRALQGVGAGGVAVLAAAIVAGAVPEEARGRAFSVLFGAQMAGTAIGPAVGTLVGTWSMTALFLGAGALGMVALGVVAVRVPRSVAGRGGGAGAGVRAGAGAGVDTGGLGTGAPGAPGAPGAEGRRRAGGRPRRSARARRPGWLWRHPAILGALVVSASGGVLVGTYEVDWSLLLNLRGAMAWEIGLSWTLFAAPFAVLSWPAGWLVDHWDRRWLAAASVVSAAAFAAIYPFLPSVALLIGLGAAEAAGTTLTFPAMQSILTGAVPAAELGRAEGLLSSAQTGAVAVAAAGAGVAFGVFPWLPFVASACLGGLAAASLAVLWRRVPGRAGTPIGVTR